MFDRIKSAYRAFRNPLAEKTQGKLAATFDNAETTDDNRRHWERARDKPVTVELTPDVRMKLRERCSYERDNNSYCSGLMSTRATDLIGYTLPKLRIAADNPEIKSTIEMAWDEWSKHEYVNLSSKLRVMDETTQCEGESFIAQFSDDALEKEFGIGLNVNVIGAARVCDAAGNRWGTYKEGEYNDDGLIIDLKTGRPKRFKVIPAEDAVYGLSAYGDAPTVDPKYMKQWFRPRRPGQFRGYSEYAPCLGLYAQLRRYDLATLDAAEFAAMLAGVMYTSQPVDPDSLGSVKPWTKAELERGTLLGLPLGYKAEQFKPEQPLTQYQMFVNMILRQIGRAMDVPFGIVAGDSSSYNYSSARLDYQGYEARIKYDREQLTIRQLNCLFKDWLFEWAVYMAVKGKRIYKDLIESKGIGWKWTFTSRPSSDPSKDAEADAKRLETQTDNLAGVYAARGLDWEEELEQRSKELQKMKKLGLDSSNGAAIMRLDDATKVSVPDGVPQTTEQTTETPVVETQTEAAQTGDVQASALNGAQITSLKLIADEVVAKRYPEDAAIALIQAAFPLMDTALIKKFVGLLAKHEAPEAAVAAVTMKPSSNGVPVAV